MNRFWLKNSMNTNTIKMQIFIKWSMAFKRSLKVTFTFENQLFLRYIFCLKSDLIKTLYVWILDHFYAIIFLAHSFIDQFWWKLILISLRGFKISLLSDNLILLQALPFVLMDNFCPFFVFFLSWWFLSFLSYLFVR